jgi:Na+-driven multidrug efflux pump
MQAISHGALLVIGLLAILAGLGLAIIPRYFGFLAGPGASKPHARQWTRYQGLGFMLLGAAFVMASGARSGDLVPTVVLAMVACLLFAMAVLRRQQDREQRQRART